MKPGDRRVIQVSIFGNQNEPLLGVRPEKLQGKIVGLRNVRPKMGSTDYLEATMVEDYKYKDRRDVTLIQGGSKANQLSCPPGWKEAFMACVFRLLRLRSQSAVSQSRADASVFTDVETPTGRLARSRLVSRRSSAPLVPSRRRSSCVILSVSPSCSTPLLSTR